ncbi:MAG: NAD(P)/FAD-dependent oxidoreductase [Fimbriimonadaceae bacterium]
MANELRVAVVGAGIAGLATARLLTQSGVSAVVFEKSRGYGGRAATRRLKGYTFDTGATSVTPRGLEIGRVIREELDTSELVEIEKPVFVFQGDRVVQGDASRAVRPRYTYRSGMTRLAKLLAAEVDVRLETTIDVLEPHPDGRIVVRGEAFDYVVLTPPLPQTVRLLATLGDPRTFEHAAYRCCLSVLLGFRAEIGEVPYFAVIDPEQRRPLTWLSLESVKSPGRAPAGCTAMVAQLGPGYSAARYDTPDDRIVENVVDYIRRSYGATWPDPEVSAVKRWRYSQPEIGYHFGDANPPGVRVIVAGDGTTAPRIENAYESGVLAAKRILAECGILAVETNP